jgi:hypothetical protein
MNLPPTNVLLGKLKNDNDAELEEGNVLMIKHPLREVRQIDNMTPTDVACATKLLRWWVTECNLWRWLIAELLKGRCIEISVGFRVAEKSKKREGINKDS